MDRGLWTLPAAFPHEFVERQTNRWRRAFRANPRLRATFKAERARLGVHQPIAARDVLSSNFFLKYGALAETQQALDFAHYVNADYFVFHLAMQDRWDWDRRDQMDKALKMFKMFAAYYHARGYRFTPCVENLEYPKFPATGGEACALLVKCRDIWPATQLALDISHLWGTRQRMMALGLWEDPRVSFNEALCYTLDQTWEDVHVFHLGGCWESETHAVPGLHPHQDPFHYPLKLREPASIYAENNELDLNLTLDLLLQYSVGKGRDLNLVLEIFDRDIDQVCEAARVLRAELEARARGEVPARSFEPARMTTPARVKRTRAKKSASRARKKKPRVVRKRAG
jgi:hypothetical protein